MPYCCMHISYIQEYGILGGRNDVYSVSNYIVIKHDCYFAR